MFHSSHDFCACAFYLLYFGLFSNFFSKDDPRRTVPENSFSSDI